MKRGKGRKNQICLVTVTNKTQIAQDFSSFITESLTSWEPISSRQMGTRPYERTSINFNGEYRRRNIFAVGSKFCMGIVELKITTEDTRRKKLEMHF